jgi:muramoyltetrapeptide carboxypeptidase
MMIKYPYLKQEATIGVTAPSSGVPSELHPVLQEALSRMKENGFRVVSGETTWMQDKVRSAPATQRAAEFQRMMLDDNIDIIIPPWGGELLIEVLEHLDFEQMREKWVLGYSDTSLLPMIEKKRGFLTCRSIQNA